MKEKKLKKLYIITRSMKAGGCEHVIAQLANRFCSEGIEVSLFTVYRHESFYPLDERISVRSLNDREEGRSRDTFSVFRQFRQLVRDGKPDGFHYSEHRTVDSKNNVIVNVHVEPANVNDITPVSKILKEIKHRLGKLPKYMGFDAGYHSAWIAHLLEKNNVQGVIGYRRHTHQQEVFGKYRFRYEPYFDAYICPEGKHLYWKTTNRTGYREYWSSSKDCANCPRKSECMSEKAKRRLVTRHVWQDALEEVTWFTKTTIGRRIYSWRKQTIERSFAEAKENHGLRFARMLGIQNMREQCFLTAAAQNIKRLVMA